MLAISLALLALAQVATAGQCRTASITFRVNADPEAGQLEVDRSPVPYGR